MGETEWLSKEKVKVLAERNGWALGYAEGYVDGEYQRRRSNPIAQYAAVGIDEYSLGFRAGYYMRKGPDAITNTVVDRPGALSMVLSTS